MITSPINPMRYWKLEEIQSMLNKIEGYENVVIEFQCKQADGWNKLNWDCKYGIKEQLINGQWNWLLKHRFVIEAKTELDAHNSAWQEAAERLVTDVWKNSIHAFRNEQKQIMTTKQQRQTALQQEIEQKLTGTNTTNIMNETNRMDMKLMNNIQTKNITWTETNRWIVSVGIVGGLLGLAYGLYTIGWLLNFGVGIFLTWLLTMVVFLVKHLIDELTDGR